MSERYRENPIWLRINEVLMKAERELRDLQGEFMKAQQSMNDCSAFVRGLKEARDIVEHKLDEAAKAVPLDTADARR